MGVQTFEVCRELVVPEPHPYRGEIGYLTVAELGVLALLCAGNQERIPRDLAGAVLLGRPHLLGE